ncbi:MAG: hypothetical protein H0T79_13690 [Deltaproteobacteria bacterium]|nr:hypothetical protein [Deltaproteobacteria bacterium]
MRPAPLMLAIIGFGVSSLGCPSDPASNPPVLWLGLDGRETEVKLIDHEPPPY